MASKVSMSSKVPMGSKFPMGSKVPMATKVSMATKSSMATKVTLDVFAHMKYVLVLMKFSLHFTDANGSHWIPNYYFHGLDCKILYYS